jgi:hypothetical protein
MLIWAFDDPFVGNSSNGHLCSRRNRKRSRSAGEKKPAMARGWQVQLPKSSDASRGTEPSALQREKSVKPFHGVGSSRSMLMGSAPRAYFDPHDTTASTAATPAAR